MIVSWKQLEEMVLRPLEAQGILWTDIRSRAPLRRDAEWLRPWLPPHNGANPNYGTKDRERELHREAALLAVHTAMQQEASPVVEEDRTRVIDMEA